MLSILKTLVFSLAFHLTTAEYSIYPKIGYQRVDHSWQNISLPEYEKPVFFSGTGADLVLNCTAPYAIQWRFYGYIFPTEVVHIRPPKKQIEKNEFQIKVFIFFAGGKNSPELGASARVVCENLEEPEISDEFKIFVRGNGNSALVPPDQSTITNSNLIPCATRNPLDSPSLFKINKKGEEKPVRDNVRYEPTKGFLSKNVFHGLFVCKQGDSAVTIKAEKTPQPSGYDLQPISKFIRSFTDSHISFQCKSLANEPVRLIAAKLSENLTFSITAEYNFATANLSSNFPTNGSITCLSGSPGNDTLIMEWLFEFVETPELYLDSYSGEVHCLSNVKQKLLQTIRCRNTMECQFMSRCLKNETLCNFQTHKQFFSRQDIYCIVPKYEKSRNCLTVPYTYLNGLAQCSVDGLVKMWEYFVSLDYKKYFNWKEAPINEIIRMDDIKPVLYIHAQSRFYCQTVAYLFADNIFFEMEFINGTRVQLKDNGDSIKIRHSGNEDPRKIDELNIVGILDIRIPIDAEKIHCVASWWNGTDGLRTTKTFRTSETPVTDGCVHQIS